MPRVAALRTDGGTEGSGLSVLTSAMRFSDGWYWVGTSKWARNGEIRGRMWALKVKPKMREFRVKS